jgi:hypothetical protein
MSIGSIGIQALTGASGTPQYTASEASDRKIETSNESTTADETSTKQAQERGKGDNVDKTV